MENFSLFPTDWVDVVEMRTSLVHPTTGTAWNLCTTAVAQSVDRKHMVLEIQWADIAEDKERRSHDFTTVRQMWLRPFCALKPCGHHGKRAQGTSCSGIDSVHSVGPSFTDVHVFMAWRVGSTLQA